MNTRIIVNLWAGCPEPIATMLEGMLLVESGYHWTRFAVLAMLLEPPLWVPCARGALTNTRGEIMLQHPAIQCIEADAS